MLHAGMKLIQRHRKINEVLKEQIAEIHALQIAKCQTPAQAGAAT
jgi:stress-induced morphogen